MAERTDFYGSNTPKCPKSPCSFQKTGCSFHSFEPILSKRAKKKSPKNLDFSGFFGGELGIRTLGTFLYTAFRVFYSQHTLADFEEKCPILRVNALVRKKMIFSPLRLFPTVRNTRELSERTNRTAIKHNNRKSPLNQWFSELRQLKRSFDFECVM